MNTVIRVQGLDEFRKDMAAMPKEINRALGRAVTDAARHGRTEASSIIRGEYAIRKKDLDKAINISQKGRSSSPMSVLLVSSRPINLIDFNAEQTQTVRGNTIKWKGRGWTDRKRAPKSALGVTVQVKRGQKARIKPAFIAYSRFGQLQVFLRNATTKKIAPMYVKTITSFLLGSGRMERLKASIQRVLDSRALHHVGRALRGEK